MGAIRDRLSALKTAAGRITRRLSRAQDGNVAMIFALSLPVLTMMAVFGVDIHRASAVRTNLQDALDAATLAAARSPYLDDENLTRIGLAALNANLQAYPQIQLQEELTTFHLTDSGAIQAAAKVDVDALIANIVLPPYGKLTGDQLRVSANSEVVRSSKDVEVSLVLDLTGSMTTSKLASLKSAAKDLIDLVVQDQQTPFYSRVALVPYSMGVNVGSRAQSIRGAVAAPAAISGAGWQLGTTQRSIGSVSRANPAVVRSNGHGYTTGDTVWITGVGGMTQLNDRAFTVTRVDSNNFRLNGVDSRNWSNASGGTVRECRVSGCEIVVDASNHGLSDGEYAYITGVQGMTQINNRLWTVSNATTNSYSLAGTDGPEDFSAYSRNGSSFCTREGCEYFTFINAWGGRNLHRISTCVSERTGTHAYTDASPSSAFVGRNYPNSGNTCLEDEITPLSSDRDTLHGLIDGYGAVGSTAGQIGLAWGWYMVSPTFGSIFSGEGRPGAFDDTLLKVVILMTDGEFNTPYARGVIAANAGSGSGDGRVYINQNATNGTGFEQANALCQAMREQGIIVYTVGFDIPSVTDTTSEVDTAEELMETCATTADHAYLPATGQDLEDAFAAIGREITQLRIAR